MGIRAFAPSRNRVARSQLQRAVGSVIETLERRTLMAFGDGTIGYVHGAFEIDQAYFEGDFGDPEPTGVVSSSPLAGSATGPSSRGRSRVNVGLGDGKPKVLVPSNWSLSSASSGHAGFDPISGLVWSSQTGFAQGRGSPIGVSIGFDTLKFPHLGISSSGNRVTLFKGGVTASFDKDGSSVFQGRDGSNIKGYEISDSYRGDVYVILSPDGSRDYFEKVHGMYRGSTDPWGNETTVTAGSGAYEIARVDRRSGGTSGTILESVIFTYNGSGYLTSASYRRAPAGGGTVAEYAKLEYDYYGSGDSNGAVTDVKIVRLLVGGAEVGSQYFRYYTGDGTDGREHHLKYVFEDAGLARLKADRPSDWSTASDSLVHAYSTLKVNLNTSGVVTSFIRAGSGAYHADDASPGDGFGTFSYSFSNITNQFAKVNRPSRLTTLTRPDGIEVRNYSNPAARPLVTHTWNGQTDSSRLDWVTSYEYDAKGVLQRVSSPSASRRAASAQGGTLDFFNHGGNYYWVSQSEGVVDVFEYYGSGQSGGPQGYLKAIAKEHGDNLSSRVVLTEYTYETRTVGSLSAGLIAAVKTYPVAGGSARTTSNSYTFDSGEFGPATVTTTYPTISTGTHGSGTASVMVSQYDSLGRIGWTKNAAGYINGYSYDDATNAVTLVWQDANGSAVSSATGWTPNSSALNLKTTYEVDRLGRATKIVSPRYDGLSNNNTFVTYIVYKTLFQNVGFGR